MTEDEAKTKWCPFYRVATSGGDMSTFEIDNRPKEYEEFEKNKWRPTGRYHEDCRCIGSACMAWRATDNEAVPAAGVTLAELENAKYKSAGFCGLVRKE